MSGFYSPFARPINSPFSRPFDTNVAMLGSGVAPPPFLDTFTDVDATSLVDHTSDSGHTWTASPVFTGTATINDNAASCAASLKNWYSSWVPDSADYQCTMQIDITDGVAISVQATGIGPSVRLSSSGNAGYCFLIAGNGLTLLDINAAFVGDISFNISNGSYNAICGVIGTTVYCRLQRLSDNKWLNPSLAWVSSRCSVIKATRTTVSAAGAAGIWLCPGSASTPPTADTVYGDVTAGEIAITSPVTYQMFQRDTVSLLSDIAITGTYLGSPTEIEASFNSGAYATIDASPTGGTFSGTLTGQASGQGNLIVRFKNDRTTSASVAYIGIGEWFAIGGQSNAVGQADNNQFYSHPTLKAVIYSIAGNYAECIDPFSGGPKGSYWQHVATGLMAELNCPVGFIPNAVDGSSITTWEDGDTSHENLVTRSNAVGGIRAILWHQGETDAIASMSQATYQGHINAMADAFAASLDGAPTVACLLQDSVGITDPDEVKIRAAVTAAAISNANIYLGPDLSDLVSDDPYHLQIDAKIQAAGQRWAASLIDIFF